LDYSFDNASSYLLNDLLSQRPAATSASLSPRGLIANLVMFFNPAAEKSATCSQLVECAGNHLNSFESFADKRDPSGVHT
jgi:hypothetical protein